MGHEHDLACHASLPEQLVRVSCLGQWHALRDERRDRLLVQEVKQGEEILAKPGRSPPLQPLDAVGHYSFPAREQPATRDGHPEDGESPKALPTPWTTCRQSSPTKRGRQAISHDPSARTERLAGPPDMGTTDAVKDDVYTFTREAVHFFHEVLLLVINGESAQGSNGGRPS
jgi:hypothetical protein